MFFVITKDICEFFCRYIGQGSKVAFIVFLVFLISGIFYIRWNNKSCQFYAVLIIKSIFVSLLIVYIYVVAGITLLSRDQDYDSHVNLLIFSTFCDPLIEKKYIYENILMLVPFAMLLFILAKPFRNIYISMLTGFIFSLLIEIIQFFTNLGSFIIDDLLTNTLGMLIGFLLCKIIEIFVK